MTFEKLAISTFTKTQLRRMEEMEKCCGLEPFSRRMLLESVANMDTYALIDGTQIMGFITLHPSNRYLDGGVYIVNLNVAPEYRRQGVATRLILAACSMFAQLFGDRWVTLDVRKDNSAAISLYTKLGFTAVEETSWNGDTDIVMAISMKDLLKILVTPRLMMKRMTIADGKEGTKLLRDGRINKTYMIPDLTEEAAEKLFCRFCDLSANDSRYIRGIYQDNALVGFINDTEISDRTIELGWVVDPEHQNLGFATEAVRHAIKDLFSYGFEEVTAGAFEENPASIRVMEKSGMRVQNKQEWIEYRGKNHRCVYYAVRREE